MIDQEQLSEFERNGHLTIAEVFDEETIRSALADVEAWSQEFLNSLPEDKRAWYLERNGSENSQLRKLDEPVFHRDIFQQMASSKRLVQIVEQLIGPGVNVFFSQVFCKPPEGGGPKPVHQDNYYFGPDNPEATLTVWCALDEATVENGCLFYGDGSHRGPIREHVAPDDQPFNLQIPDEKTGDYKMTPAPVPAGGVSIHHGNTWHQSSSNLSKHARRAVAMHYLRNDAELVRPALRYDPSVVVNVS